MAKIVLAICTAILFVSEASYAFQTIRLAPSDSLTSKNWTIEDGLPVNAVNSITQDNDGFIWFTTYDGLVRFDGLNFKVYNHANTEAMPHNRTTHIHIQQGVGMWMAMEYVGMILIQDGKFYHFGPEQGMVNSDITHLFELSDYRMFFTTHDGPFIFQNGEIKRFFRGENELQERANHILEEEDGSIWMATHDGMFYFREGEEPVKYDISDIPEQNSFWRLARDRDGTIIAGTRKGVYYFDGSQFKPVAKYKEINGLDVYRIYIDEEKRLFSTVRGLFEERNGSLVKLEDNRDDSEEAYYKFFRDSNGQLWVIGDQGTLSIYKDGRLVAFDAIRGLKDIYYNEVYEDKEGNIWLSTNKNGLFRIKKTIVRTIGKLEGLSGDNILGLYQDSEGIFWAGTRGDGLNKIDGNKITYYTLFNSNSSRSISSNIVHSIVEDTLGDIWIGNYQKGIDIITPEKVKHIDFGKTPDLNDIRALYRDHEGNIWAGTYGGLVKVDQHGEDHKIFDRSDGLTGMQIRYITQAEDNSYWIGTLDGGVSHYKDGKFQNYTHDQGLSSNNIRSVYVDEFEEGVVWVGTENNGLNRIKNGKITFVNMEDGLPDYNIHWITQDENGWLWMSSNKGVIKILKSELNAYLNGKLDSFRLIHFGRQDGMRNPEGNGSFQEAGIRTNNNKLWFSTQEGVAIFETTDEVKAQVFPKVIISDVVAKGESFSTDSIRFDSDIDDFTIYFHAVTFTNPEKTRFRYKMGDLTQDWVEIGYEREVHFSDTPPGDYTFLVQATNSEGEWGDGAGKLLVTVTPKYYQRVWFYLLLVVGLVGLFTMISKLRFQRLIKKQEKLEDVINEQTRQLRAEKSAIEEQKKVIEKQAQHLEEVNKTKDKFFSIIAHDLKNPFQAMLGYSEFLESDLQKMDKKELTESIGIIRKSSKSLYNLTENLLHWANLQTGKIKPHIERCSVAEIIEKNKSLFLQSAKQKNIQLNFEAEKEIDLMADRNMIDTVIRNLVSNAIKFTNQDGKVMLKAGCKETYCTIEISDNGIGMNDELLSGVLSLDSKSRRDGTGNETGTGLGLILCKEMVEMNSGKLEIESVEGKGTTFRVILPCANDY